jgi:hypothetical protein
MLELIRRELHAASAHLELGAEPARNPAAVSHALDDHWRVVVTFAEGAPPVDAHERLDNLIHAFTSSIRPSLERPSLALGRPPAERRLDEELGRLGELLLAKASVIIDESSPIIWGTATPQDRAIDVELFLALARLIKRFDGELKELAELLWEASKSTDPHLATPIDAKAKGNKDTLRRELGQLSRRIGAPETSDWYRLLLTASAVAAFRKRRHSAFRGRHVAQPPPVGYVAQALASQYLLLFVFDEPFSQLHAEATAVHAVPYLENLIGDLPPVDPPRGAKAQRLPRLKLV